MTIKFNCEHCRKEIQAPDAAGGKRGKCPFCGTSNYIPAPVGEDDVIPLAPLDESEERQRQKEIQDLLNQERDILAETGGQPKAPEEDNGSSSKQALHDLVVNYCLDMHSGKIERAATHAEALRDYGPAAVRMTDDFMSGKEIEPALATMPGGLLQGFLRKLKQSL